MRIALLSLLLMFLLVPAAVAQDKTASDIRKVLEDQTAAWNRGDLDAFMSIGYWRSEKLKFISGDKITNGWQQTLDNYKRTYNTKEKMGTLTFSDLEIDVLAKDAAVVHGSWRLKRETDEPKGKFTLIFRKLKEGWRIVTDHTS